MGLRTVCKKLLLLLLYFSKTRNNNLEHIILKMMTEPCHTKPSLFLFEGHK